MTTECPNCGDEFKKIGLHWTQSSDCDHPKLTQEQREIATGLLMGDGCIIRQKGRNPKIVVEMTTKKYLNYLDNKFGIMGTGVRLSKTAKQSAEEDRKTKFSKGAKAENYSDVYRWYTRHTPKLKEFENWYSTGTKVWPEDIELTPIVLKHWYCGDGTWDNKNGDNRIQIAMANEVENTEKVDKLFENVGLPSPSNYNIFEIENGSRSCYAYFTVDQSKELWEYMGKPLPDFEYKWPEKYRS